MITKEEKHFILKYVDAAHYDQEKLIKYLNMHDIVGNEIFSYCDKRAYRKDQPTYSTWLDDEDGYVPLSVSDFIRRIPFYFYAKDVESMDLENMGTLHYIFSASSDISLIVSASLCRSLNTRAVKSVCFSCGRQKE